MAKISFNHEQKRALFYKRGLIPVRHCYDVLGIKASTFQALVRSGKIPGPRHTPELFLYTVEQLAHLVEAKFNATVDMGSYSIFRINDFIRLVNTNWPLGDEDEQIACGKKERKWRRSYNNGNKDSVQSNNGRKQTY